MDFGRCKRTPEQDHTIALAGSATGGGIELAISQDDAEMLVAAYGTAARIAKGGVARARSQGLKVGMFRPKTLWPFPSKSLAALSRKVKRILVFEMSTGQMVEDIQLAAQGRCDVVFYGRPGGVVSTPEELERVITSHYHKIASAA